MLDDIYNKRILELAGQHPAARAPRDARCLGATAHSKLCGSTVTVDLKVDGGVVTDFAHEVKACALGQASSSIMARHVVGSTAEELRDVREAMRRMLKENGGPPEGKWAELGVLEPVRDFKARHASTMLTFDAVVDALEQIEARQRRAGGGMSRPAPPAAAHVADPRLPAHPVRPRRPPMPAPAVVLGLHRRGDPAPRPLGRRLDGRGADLPLRALRHLRPRPRSGGVARPRPWYKPWAYGRWRGVLGAGDPLRGGRARKRPARALVTHLPQQPLTCFVCRSEQEIPP